ncbi:MAG: MarC family protein [Candidatus Sulfotelmatobacter sp.]
MGDAVKVLFLVLSALYPTVDPLSGGPIFLALTSEYSPQERRILSWRVAVDSLFLLLGAYFVGAHVLNFFAVSLPVVQVGGGLVVISIGWKMLMDDKGGDNHHGNQVGPSDIYGRAFYPLTLPLTVSPGSISVGITLGANSTHRYGVHVSIVLAAVIAMIMLAISIFLCYGFADRLAQILGKAMPVIVRLSSFLLLCIGVQIMWNGIGVLLSSVLFQTS